MFANKTFRGEDNLLETLIEMEKPFLEAAKKVSGINQDALEDLEDDARILNTTCRNSIGYDLLRKRPTELSSDEKHWVRVRLNVYNNELRKFYTPLIAKLQAGEGSDACTKLTDVTKNHGRQIKALHDQLDENFEATTAATPSSASAPIHIDKKSDSTTAAAATKSAQGGDEKRSARTRFPTYTPTNAYPVYTWDSWGNSDFWTVSGALDGLSGRDPSLLGCLFSNNYSSGYLTGRAVDVVISAVFPSSSVNSSYSHHHHHRHDCNCLCCCTGHSSNSSSSSSSFSSGGSSGGGGAAGTVIGGGVVGTAAAGSAVGGGGGQGGGHPHNSTSLLTAEHLSETHGDLPDIFWVNAIKWPAFITYGVAMGSNLLVKAGNSIDDLRKNYKNSENKMKLAAEVIGGAVGYGAMSYFGPHTAALSALFCSWGSWKLTHCANNKDNKKAFGTSNPDKYLLSSQSLIALSRPPALAPSDGKSAPVYDPAKLVLAARFLEREIKREKQLALKQQSCGRKFLYCVTGKSSWSGNSGFFSENYPRTERQKFLLEALGCLQNEGTIAIDLFNLKMVNAGFTKEDAQILLTTGNITDSSATAAASSPSSTTSSPSFRPTGTSDDA